MSGASKPTLAPFGHLQKFAHDSSSKTSATSVTTATVNSNNSQTRSSSVMLSPQILPCRADIAIKAKRNKTEKLEEKNDQGRSKSRKLISEENEEGYVSLSVAV